MFNKIYDKLVKFIKEEYKSILIYLLFLIICLYPLPYYLFTGGGLVNLSDRISIIDEYTETGSFNMSYVRQVKATIPTYLLSYILGWEKESINDSKIDTNENNEDVWKREQLYLQEGNDNAIINAYQLAGEKITINKENLQIISFDNTSDTNLQIGDIILKINNSDVIDTKSIQALLDSKNVDDSIELMVLRNDKEVKCYANIIEIDGYKKIGVYLLNKVDYTTDKKVDIYVPDNEGGSSGGLMTALEIYNRLTKKDLTSGLKIAGTGTIDRNGMIGKIGGVKYKLMGAVSGKADIFLVPDENYEEAVSVKKEKKYNIEIVKVKTLKEAVTYLESR